MKFFHRETLGVWGHNGTNTKRIVGSIEGKSHRVLQGAAQKGGGQFYFISAVLRTLFHAATCMGLFHLKTCTPVKGTP